MRPVASCTPLAFAPLVFAPAILAATPSVLRALRPLAARRRPVPVDSRSSQRLRVAAGWPSFEVRFGEDVFPLLDVSEEGFQLDIADGAVPPDRARASIRRNGEERQRGVARRVWVGARSVGYRFETVAAVEPETLLAGSRSAARLRRRLRL